MVEWISLKEKMPPDTIYTILVGRDSDHGVSAAMAAMFFDGKFIAYGPAGAMEFTSPTHWAEFPEPPLSKYDEEQRSDAMRDPDVAYYVLYSDGTWAGGFETLNKAIECRKMNGGQVVSGKWFDDK